MHHGPVENPKTKTSHSSVYWLLSSLFKIPIYGPLYLIQGAFLAVFDVFLRHHLWPWIKASFNQVFRVIADLVLLRLGSAFRQIGKLIGTLWGLSYAMVLGAIHGLLYLGVCLLHALQLCFECYDETYAGEKKMPKFRCDVALNDWIGAGQKTSWEDLIEDYRYIPPIPDSDSRAPSPVS